MSELQKAYISIEMPPNIAKAVPEHNDPHVTLGFMQFEEDKATSMGIIRGLIRVCKGVTPFNLVLDGTDGLKNFPKGEDGYPVWVPVRSEPDALLSSLHERIKAFICEESPGVEFSSHTYIPHMTWKYTRKRPNLDPVDFKHSFTVQSLRLNMPGAEPAHFRLRGYFNPANGEHGQRNDPNMPISPFRSNTSPTGPRGTDGPNMAVPGSVD